MTRPLHVVQVCLSSWGGSSVVAADLAMALARAGHRSTVVSGVRPPRLEDPSPSVRWVPVEVGPHPALQHAGAHAIALAGRLIQLAQDEPVDIVHCHYAVPHAAAAWLARLALGVAAPRVVVSLHGSDATDVSADPQYQPLLRAALLHADLVTVPSHALAAQAQAALQLPTSPLVVANSVDETQFMPAASRDRAQLAALFGPSFDPATEPVLLHLSNFRPVKRTLALATLLASLQEHIACRLVLVGDGPERAAVAKALSEAGIADRCAMLPPRADCRELLQHSDIFLLPSAHEGFGLAALEALACATPVVASGAGGLTEVVRHGATGLLVPVGDDAALLAAVLQLLRNPRHSLAMGQAGRTDVLLRFGRDAGVARWLAAYDQVLAG